MNSATRITTGLLASAAGLALAASPAMAASHTFHTVGTDINIRTGASSATQQVATINRKGDDVSVSCYVTGQSVSGDNIWYRVVWRSPDGGTYRGYVAGYWLDTNHDPNPVVSKC